MDVLFGNGPEAMTTTMKRMIALQEERTKRMSAVHARYQTALSEARTRHVTRYREGQKHLEKRRAHYVAKMSSSVQRRKELESSMQDLIRRMESGLIKVEELMLTGYDGREADAKAAAEGKAAFTAAEKDE
ncbi:hypothetical protein XA68_12891 [Ophiocordyceps unilateralis]|uniref:Uncharacterized protein n=1 Tax=Ophiocordyceps unilateralis TaxID=268505 RepID=A0A2A9PDS9_OPHUN|nr:hypothetical protein XA68_12891 [Ophiocordyceps unilateralis]